MKKEQSSTGRAFVAGAVGGVIAVVVMAILAAVLMRRLGPRMMRCCCGSGEMRVADEPTPKGHVRKVVILRKEAE